MKLYGLKTCDSCRKALKKIKKIEFFDVRTDGVPEEVLKKAFAKFDTALINTRSSTWRGLNADQKEIPMLDLLTQFPTLMKRPLIDYNGNLYLGWTSDVQDALG